jgi:hypothetical protein
VLDDVVREPCLGDVFAEGLLAAVPIDGLALGELVLDAVASRSACFSVLKLPHDRSLPSRSM